MADEPTEEPAAVGSGIRIADHPQARRSIARAKAWGGVVGFGITAWFSWQAGTPFAEATLRSVGIGAATALAVWALAQAAWKQIIFAELAARRREAVETQKAILSELDEHTARDDLA